MTQELYRSVLDICDQIESTVEAFGDGRDTSLPAPTSQQLQIACEALKTEAAKLGFMYSQPTQPSATEGVALLQAFHGATVTACATLLHTGGVTAGPALRKVGRQTAETVSNASVGLLKTAFARPEQQVGSGGSGGGNNNNNSDVVVKAAGLLIERCDVAAKSPLDNKTAIGRGISMVARHIADAIQELSAAEADALTNDNDDDSEGNQTGAAHETNGINGKQQQKEDNDDGFGDFDTSLTTQELALLHSVKNFLSTISDILRTTLKTLLNTPSTTVDTNNGEAWESVLFHIQQLRATVDDVAACCYPPQDGEEVGSAVEALVTGCELISEEVDSLSGSGGDGGGGSGVEVVVVLPLEGLYAARDAVLKCLNV